MLMNLREKWEIRKMGGKRSQYGLKEILKLHWASQNSSSWGWRESRKVTALNLACIQPQFDPWHSIWSPKYCQV